MTEHPNYLAEAKAALARKGVHVRPDATAKALPRPTSEFSTVIVLQRVGDGTLPDHCVHGHVQCIRCFEWCWLGHESGPLVERGDAAPVCLECATEVMPRDAATRALGNVNDHKRADGPHE